MCYLFAQQMFESLYDRYFKIDRYFEIEREHRCIAIFLFEAQSVCVSMCHEIPRKNIAKHQKKNRNISEIAIHKIYIIYINIAIYLGSPAGP